MMTPKMALIVSVGMAMFLYLMALWLIIPRVKASRALTQRWKQYQASNILDQNKVARIDERRLQSIRSESKLKAFLVHPFSSFKDLEFFFYRTGVLAHLQRHIIFQAIGMALVIQLLIMFSPFSFIQSIFMGTILVTILQFLYLKRKDDRWKKDFITIFPLSLDVINRGLKSGLTLGRGIAMVSEEMADPVGGEFNYMAAQLQLGVSPDAALTEAAMRIGVDEFRFFSLALIIQREMGGSLADILGKLSEVIRERDRFRKKVWTLSSESRATALIVGSLPLFLGIMVEMISPGYIKFFFVDPRGQMMLWISVGLTITGSVVITRMMKMES